MANRTLDGDCVSASCIEPAVSIAHGLCARHWLRIPIALKDHARLLFLASSVDNQRVARGMAPEMPDRAWLGLVVRFGALAARACGEMSDRQLEIMLKRIDIEYRFPSEASTWLEDGLKAIAPAILRKKHRNA